jgi:hypothetical protein
VKPRQLRLAGFSFPDLIDIFSMLVIAIRLVVWSKKVGLGKPTVHEK